MNKKLGVERGVLGLIFLFIAMNWLFMCLAEKIGPPDFYSIFRIGERLYEGNWNIEIVPPLFPLILYPLGKFVSLFMKQGDAFLVAGRLLSLISGLGVIWMTYLILKKYTDTYCGLMGVVLISISPWFLKLLPFPITDMIYLFFFVGAFYLFSIEGKRVPVLLAITAGALTRYEGILLFLSGIFMFFKSKKRYIVMLVALGVLSFLLLLFFYLFSPRIFALWTDIIVAQKTYLFVFLHPVRFFHVIYANLFFFFPSTLPFSLKMLLSIILLGLGGYGFYTLFKIQKRFALSLGIYGLIFFIAKGYVNAGDPEREFRRIASGLWIFYIVAFLGSVFLFKKYKKKAAIAASIISIALIVPWLKMVTDARPYLILPVILIAVILVIFKLTTSNRIRFAFGVISVLLIWVVYPRAYIGSEAYAVSYARKSAFVSAQWLNTAPLKKNGVVLSYTDNTILYYYLDKPRILGLNIQIIQFTVPMGYTGGQDKNKFKEYFFREAKKQKVDYIIFDHYLVEQPEFLGVNEVYAMLIDTQFDTHYFSTRRDLYYKGINVCTILKLAD